MADVTIIFDEFGHSNQPYLSDWFELLCGSQKLTVKGLAKRNTSSNKHDIVSLRPEDIYTKFKRGLKALLHGYKLNSAEICYGHLREIDSDIIHFVKAQMLVASKKFLPNDKKIVCSFRGFDTLVYPESNQEWKKELRWIYERAEALHFVSDYIKNKAIELGAPEEKCSTIYRSVDTNFFSPSPRNLPKSVVNLLSVGRLTWEKGYMDAIKSVAILKRRGYNFHYTIVGRGVDLFLLQYHINYLGLNEHVTILEQLNREQLKQEYQKADIFLMSSLSDAMPNVVLEASAMALPIIATNVGGIPEAVLDNQTGYLSLPNAPEQLAENLIRIIENMEDGKEMGEHARRNCIKKFGREQTISKWERVYDSLVYLNYCDGK